MMKFLKILMVILILVLCSLPAFGQMTAFSYQGRLSEAGNPVTGTRFFRFTLFDENGAAINDAVIEQTLTVTNGVFNTSLDFGAANFPGANRSLLISVKINAGDAYTNLSPRQDILAAPYSIKSKTSDTATNADQLGGVDSSGFVQKDAGGNVSIAGGLTVAETLSLDTVNAQTQYNLGGDAGSANSNGSNNTFVGYGAQGFSGNNVTNSTAIGANSAVLQSNSLVPVSINGVNNATADTQVGIGTTTPKAKLDVTGGNILVGSPGQGIILKSPAGATCKLLSIDNAGAMVLTAITCP